MLQLAADVPAAQNHIFGDNVAETSNIDVLRIEAKPDRILENGCRNLTGVCVMWNPGRHRHRRYRIYDRQISCITPKTPGIMVMFVIIVAGQISVLAWLGH